MTTAKKQASQTGYLHRRSDNFGKIPVELLHDKSITDGAKLLYSHMHWRYGSNCDNHEGRASMGEFLGVSETTITKRANELVAKDWIVALPRTDDRGRTSNFYHVFEVQEDCIKWREEHDKPKPTSEIEPRKSRQGKGGRNTHRPKGSEETQVKVSGETQVNQPSKPELSIPVNLSSHNPDSYYPDTVIQTQEKTLAPASPAPVHSEPTGQDDKPTILEKSSEPKEKGSGEKEKAVQSHVALIEAYHWSLPDDVRPPGEPPISRHSRVAVGMVKAGLTPYDVVRFVTLSYHSYRMWAESKGASSMMSFEHVNQHIKGYLSAAKGLTNGYNGTTPLAKGTAPAPDNGRIAGVLGAGQAHTSKLPPGALRQGKIRGVS